MKPHVLGHLTTQRSANSPRGPKRSTFFEAAAAVLDTGSAWNERLSRRLVGQLRVGLIGRPSSLDNPTTRFFFFLRRKKKMDEVEDGMNGAMHAKLRL